MKESTKVHSVPGTSLLYDTSSYQISYICFGPSGTSQVQWLIVSKNHKDTKPKHSFCQKKKKKKNGSTELIQHTFTQKSYVHISDYNPN